MLAPKIRRRWHLILWIAGIILGLRGAGYLSDAFGDVRAAAAKGAHDSGDTLSSVLDPAVSRSYAANSHANSRHLLTLQNCTPRAVEQFPRDIFSQKQRMNGAITLHVIAVLYMFLCLAIVCDVYFVPSLEIFCEILNMQTDVAGATLMAAGSSAPELATSVIGVFIAKDDVGLSTVVGSAIYNVMFVISVCGFATAAPLPLNCWPLVRDCIAYLISIVALIVVIYDEKVMWYESIIFLVLYVAYILFMFYNARIEKKVLTACNCYSKNRRNSNSTVIHYEKIAKDSNGSVKLSGEESLGETTPIKHNGNGYVDPGEDCVALITNGNGGRKSADSIDYSEDSDTEIHEEKNVEPEESVWNKPSGRLSKVLWVLSIPANALMYITMPDCRKPTLRRWFWITFIMSLVWLSLFSFLMVWMITVIGFSINIPDSVMSLTFVAFGVSLPDVVASVLVARDGFGDMAVSNAVGSNVFDILVCLGIPWCIKTCMMNPGSSITIYSEGLLYASFTLLSTVVILVLGIHLNKWRLSRNIGIVFMIVYIAFTILSCLYELNVFGYLHPKECPSDY